ncbi:lipoyl(octanoyl) transferase LipB [Subtercola endophyticus]|uniref:lipoyl(octanoyl) transferase LipB n=1 Tax=Subtercola endophyticus TaxID=2895559 RepID=UPI001E2E7913|nr:lipoyl(octanoyl) transferase LipB [Subtercola endophyticus]UFS61005.1 lipoyl(octanoyl) transferase LipB [Subtercola endophyticus]
MVEFFVADVGSRTVPYEEGLVLQRTRRKAVCEGAENVVILLEHDAVYTAGRRTDDSERPTDGSTVIEVDRGGKLTWHGPGQLVGYPIVRLREPMDVVAYVRTLESVLIAVLAEAGVTGRRVEGRSGVWVQIGEGPFAKDAKIAAIGIRVADGVTSHGFALNCSNSLEPYAHIVACGIRDAGVTTITDVLGRTVDPADVIDSVQRHLYAAFAAEGSPVREAPSPGHPVPAAQDARAGVNA